MKEKYYSVALRKKISADDCFLNHSEYMFTELKIKLKSNYWLADPFLFEKDNITYLFYELFDLITCKGCIAYSILTNDYSATSPKIIIKDIRHHFSFPYIFETKDGVFIMPETCDTDSVKIYKAENFPDKWVEFKTLIRDSFSVDSIFLNYDNNDYLLCSEQYRFPPKDKVISCFVKNVMYSFNNNKLEARDGHIVSVGDNGIRNAGKVFQFNQRIIRAGQNSTGGKYGKGICFFEIESVEPYKEKLIKTINCEELEKHIEFNGESKHLIGTHTYNSTSQFEVVDFSFIKVNDFSVTIARKVITVIKKCYHFINAIARYLKNIQAKLIKEILNNGEETYKAIIDKDNPWVFVSYVADAFYHKNDPQFLNKHQNKREVVAMADVFNQLGYNAFFMLYTSKRKIPDLDIKLIFGHDPLISKASKKYPNAKLIYYGASVYFEYRNNKIKEMTDELNKTFGTKMPYRRLVEPHDSLDLSDEILLIGSNVTISTYPAEVRNKITTIHQSTQVCKSVNTLEATKSKEFLFLASSGNALKGVCPIVNYFSNHPELVLHWVGPVERELHNYVLNKMPSNIISYGFLDINSNLILGIMERCDFIVYPSGVEGVPGSVLNAMKSGLIPLVTPWASFDGIGSLGYIMDNTDEISIGKAIDWALSLSESEIINRKKACSRFVNNNYNLNVFKKEFYDYFSRILG